MMVLPLGPSARRKSERVELLNAVALEILRLQARNLRCRRLVLAPDCHVQLKRRMTELGFPFRRTVPVAKIDRFMGLWVIEDITMPAGEWCIAVAPGELHAD